MNGHSLRYCLPAVLLLGLTPLAAFAQRGPYVGPALRRLLRPDMQAAASRALSAAVPGTTGRGALLTVDLMGSAVEPRVGVLARVRGEAGIERLRAAGARIGAVVGDIVSAQVPLAALSDLSRASELAVLEAARVVHAVNDSAMVDIHADAVRQPAGGSWNGIAGQGAIVGIYDSGVDYTHEDFRTPDGETRILGIWDQTRNGTPPAGFNYGTYCAPASIMSSTCVQRDFQGHGTHVAGSAAGDGSGGSGPAYQHAGVAPLAGLLVVKGGNGSFSEAGIIDGVSWIFQEAARLGRPAVVNLSLGGQFGPHDGTRLYEQAIDNLSGPGHIVVISAGNDGSNLNTTPVIPAEFLHADGPISGPPMDFTIDIPQYSPHSGVCNDFALLEVWFEGQDRLTLTLIRPDGTSATAPFGQSIGDESQQGRIAIDNVPDGQPNPENGDYGAVVEISDCNTSAAPAEGAWKLRVTPTQAGSGRNYNLWITTSDLGDNRASGTVNFDNTHVVGSPGNATRAITVGAYVTRLCFNNILGQKLCATQKEQVGDIAYFSSPGPRRDGVLKPEITAPGRLVLSALSNQAQVPQNVTTADGAHWVLQGTSMAAPMVTGTVALMLQGSPSLTPEEARSILEQTARQDAFTSVTHTGEPAGVPNAQWGYGKLDVRAALEALGSLDVIATVAVDVTALAPPASPTSRKGSILPLLSLNLGAQGTAAVQILSIGFNVVGNDPGAQVVLLRDANANGVVDEGDAVVGSADAALTANDTIRVDVTPESLTIEPGASVALIAAIELSGATPNNTAFSLTFVPSETRAGGAQETGIVLLDQPESTVASQSPRTTVLPEDQAVSLSENPVRSAQLIINFRVTPERAAIYTVAGSLVADLSDRVANQRVVWDLKNDEGTTVAPGVYLMVVELGGERVTSKLMVLPAAGT